MWKLVWTTTALAGLAACLCACGDDGGAGPADAPPVEPDAAPDAMQPFVAPTPFSVPLAMAGPDQLQSATAAPGDKFYAAGFAAQTVGGPRFVTVVKFGTMGPDTTFGVMGVATTAVDFRGGADEIDIVTQPSGKIVVSATVANAVDPLERDIAVLRLNTDGSLDTTFGANGVRIVDLNTGVVNNGNLVGLDASRGLAVDATGRLYLHAASRGVGTATGGGPRLDTDFTVVRLGVDGAPDATWAAATGGKFLLDIQESGATPRALKVLADGSVIVSGYANSPGVGSTQPVLFKLTANGTLDTTWATGGVFHEAVLAVQTEVYNFALHGDHLVTAGYGRNAGTANDYVSLRFNVATGARDLTWGGATNGAVTFDPSGTMLGSNCRNAIALPNGRTALIGSTGPGNMPTQDAVFAILDANGRLDTAFGDGIHVYPLGANGNDQFWGGAVSGRAAVFVGYKGGGQTQTDTVNDDSYGVILRLP